MSRCAHENLTTTINGIFCTDCRTYPSMEMTSTVKLYTPPGFVEAHVDYERATINPMVGKLCVQFIKHVIPQLEQLGQRSRRHKAVAARAFLQGAYEYQVLLDGKMDHADGNGYIDDSKPQGALALFIGGSAFRSGAWNAVEHTAKVWGLDNV